jgi:hexosaminidase
MQPLASLNGHRLVPAPVSVTAGNGAPFTLGAATTITVAANDSAAARIGEMLATILRPSTGFRFPVMPGDGATPNGAIALGITPGSALSTEGYELTIDSAAVRITASTAAGLFHGMQTFRQLLPAGVEAQQSAHHMVAAWTVPPGHIVDAPRFAWRGAMLDVARHFFTADEVKQYIDLLALYKLDILHLHLADDQGWRIQIDSWPRLTTVGGSTEVGGGPGGFYTKDEYASIVRYAQDRFITIVPEIDMPAHTNAAIAAYPQLGCSKPTPGIFGGTQGPGTYTGIAVGFSALCPDSEGTFKFVDDVVREISAMTPGPYMHMGGDEVTALTNEQYTRFVERVQQIVNKYGKTMVGWEEIGKAHLAPTTIAQQWKSDSALLAFRQGAKLILSPASKVYVDMKYNPGTELGLDWAGFVDLRTSYDWDPVALLTGVPETAVVGVEAPLWSETIQNITAAEFLAVPRVPAAAEVGWSPASLKNWESFRTRIAAHGARWRLLGINYYATPEVSW